MNQLFNGSICISDLLEQANRGHSAFVKSANGKVYCNLLTWINEEADKFGNHMSYQLNSLKDKRDVEGKIYIGNAKKFERQDPQPLGQSNLSLNTDNVRTLATEGNHYSQTPVSTGGTDIAADPKDDLPF
jgi:hypothetical protein